MEKRDGKKNKVIIAQVLMQLTGATANKKERKEDVGKGVTARETIKKNEYQDY